MSTWHTPGALEEVEATILDIDSWKQWWSGLEEGRVVAYNGGVVVGGVVACTWKSLVGYRLSMRLTITDYKPRQSIEFRSEGDLVGEGSWKFRSLGLTETAMDVTWNVATTKDWMNIFGPVLRPLFVQNHNILMRKGESGLRKYVKR